MATGDPVPKPESVISATGRHWKYEVWVFSAVLLVSLPLIAQLKLKSLYWLTGTLVAMAAIKAFRDIVARQVEHRAWLTNKLEPSEDLSDVRVYDYLLAVLGGFFGALVLAAAMPWVWR